MIEFKTKNGHSELTIEGRKNELLADVCAFIKGLHKSFKDNDAEFADFFEYIVREHLGNICFDIMEDPKPDVENMSEQEKIDYVAKTIISMLDGMKSDK